MLLSTYQQAGFRFAVNEGDYEISVTLLNSDGEATGHSKRAIRGAENVPDIVKRLADRIIKDVQI